MGEGAAMKHTWQLQQAKSEFCAVAEQAARGRPQVVTKHGRPFVVIASVKDWERTAPKRKTLLEALRACPADLGSLIAARSRELPRDLSL
jgi:prevent-host-death family protein